MIGLRILAQSESYTLGHVYEAVVLIDKRKGTHTFIADHFGDPCCGVIGPNEDWFAAAGDGVTLHRIGESDVNFFRAGCRPFSESQNCRSVHHMRAEGADGVRILLDPWSTFASVWTLRCTDLEIRKVQDGPSLTEQLYRDDVDY